MSDLRIDTIVGALVATCGKCKRQTVLRPGTRSFTCPGCNTMHHQPLESPTGLVAPARRPDLFRRGYLTGLRDAVRAAAERSPNHRDDCQCSACAIIRALRVHIGAVETAAELEALDQPGAVGPASPDKQQEP